MRVHQSGVIKNYNSFVASQGEVTQLFEAHRGGDKQALDKVLPLVYDELRLLARLYLNRERVKSGAWRSYVATDGARA